MSIHWRAVAAPGAVSLVFLLLAGGGIFLTGGPAGVSAIWLANGWVLGFLLANEGSRWRHYLFTLLAAHGVLIFGTQLAGSPGVILGTANLFEIGIGYFAVRRSLPAPESLFRPETLKRFVLWVVFLAPLFTSLIACSLLAISQAEFLENFQRRFVAHSLGAIIVTPLLLAVRANWNGWSSPQHASLASWMPLLALLAVSLLVFSQEQLPLLFLLFPPFLWVLFRHSYFGCAIAIVIVSTIATAATALGTGPLTLIEQGGMAMRVLILQLLLATLVITAYPLCLLLSRRRELLQSIALSEQQLRIVTENSQDVIIHTDRDGRRTYVSPSIEDMFGYTVEEALGGRGSAAIHRDDRAMFELEEARLAAGADGTIASYRVRHRDGHFVWVEVTAKTIRDTSGKVTGWISTTRDVSERKRAEQAKADLLATISHDLRTPVMSINGAISLIRRGDLGPVSRDVAKLLDMADASAKRLVLLTNDILDIEKLSAGKMEFAPETTSVMRLLNEACLANTPYAVSKGIRLCVKQSCAAQINVDTHRMQQILANLLSNAVKYSVPGSEVELGADLHGDCCEIFVADHGSGIPENFQSRVFDRFAQADATDPRARAGAGLGMAIVKELTTSMGGAVSFESHEGAGTRVCVAFPTQNGVLEHAG